MPQFYQKLWYLFFLYLLVSINLVQSAEKHYLDRYCPIGIWPLNISPTSNSFSNTKGNLPSYLHGNKKSLPEQITGARDFLGQAWSFSNTTSSLATPIIGDMKNIGDISSTKGISLSFWIKAPRSVHKQNHRIINHHAAEVVMAGWGYGAIAFNFGKSYHVGYTKYSKDKDIIFDGKWHHIVATVDFSSRRNSVKIYLDGRLSAQNDGKANRSFNTLNEKSRLHIGSRSNGGHTFSGSLDDVALFDYPLSAKQIQEIYNGPIYAGPNIEIFLPDSAQLNPIVPAQSNILWNKKSGPENVTFTNTTNANTTVNFIKPGDYHLQMMVDSDKVTSLKIKVHPPTAPTVKIGDPVHISQLHQNHQLTPTVTMPGKKEEVSSGVSYRWEKVSGSGNAIFSDETAKNTAVSFDKKGLFRLRLTAFKNDLSNYDEISIMVGNHNRNHYLQLLNPIYLLPLDNPANRKSAGITELAEGTCAEVYGNLQNLPQLTQGAREYTGNAWDLNHVKSVIRVHNRFNLATLGDIKKTKGLSTSFWIRSDQVFSKLGRIGGFGAVDITPHKYSNGITVNIMGVPLNTSSVKKTGNLYNNKWHHIVATADFSTETNNVCLFINGKLVDKKSKKITKPMNSKRTDSTHYWGMRSNGGGHYFNGQLDDIALFDRALHEDEISYIYYGPDENHLKQLAIQKPKVNAGEEQVHKLPVNNVTLKGHVSNQQDLDLKWELLNGPGTVQFTNSNSLSTDIHFSLPSKEHHNLDYREYIFRLTAKAKGDFSKSSSDEVSIVLYNNQTPPTRNLGTFPSAGVHPRLFFSPNDLEKWRRQCKKDSVAMTAVESLKKKYKDIFSHHQEMGLVYEKLKNNEKDIDVKIVVGENDTRSYWAGSGHMYGCLAGKALIALFENNDNQLKEIGTVLSGVAQSHLTFYRPNYPNKLIHDASGGLALAYDFTASHMTEELRKPVRLLLSKMTKWRQTFGSAELDSRYNSTNWKTHHDQILLGALVIEGEEGDDPLLIKKAKTKLRTFLSQFGLFKSGYPHEGFGYYLMGMESAALSALALSRRGENLYQTTNLYNNARMMFRSMPPGCSFISNHGDTGPRVEDHSQPLNWIMRSIWPNDPAVRYLSDKRLQDLKKQENKGWDRSLNLMSILFPVPDRSPITQREAAKKLNMKLSQLCPDKGYSNFRSSWNDDALNLVFRVQHDKYNVGHGHPDINSFELYHNGTTWFLDPGKYNSYNDCHQTVLIDGIGANGSSALNSWPYLPGHYMEFSDKGKWVYGIGNAKLGYDYSPSNSNGKLERVNDTDVGSIWADFVYGKSRQDMNAMPKWRSNSVANFLHTNGKYLYRYNPVQRAFRTAALIRGINPYAIIIDDIQKDHEKRQYQWIGNLEFNTVEVVSSSNKDLIIKKKEKFDIGNRLLIRVLQADGLKDKPELVNTTIGGKKVTQVRITSENIKTPNFKILLYPFKKGEELPQTKKSSSNVSVEWSSGKEMLYFNQSESGLTKLKVL